MKLRLNHRCIWYCGLLVAVALGCIIGTTVVYRLLFSALPDEMGIPQARQGLFDLWVAVGMALGGLAGAGSAVAARGLVRKIRATSRMTLSRRWSLRFSLRTIFVLLTLLGVALALLTRNELGARRQREVTWFIYARLDGVSYYDFNLYAWADRWHLPMWIGDVCEHRLFNVVRVEVIGLVPGRVIDPEYEGDAGLEKVVPYLKLLPKLETVEVHWWSGATDDGCKRLSSQLPNIRVVRWVNPGPGQLASVTYRGGLIVPEDSSATRVDY